MLKIAHHSLYNHPLNENHRFPMIKYELIPDKLIIENTCVETVESGSMTKDLAILVGPNMKFLTTNQFFDVIDSNLKKRLDQNF